MKKWVTVLLIGLLAVFAFSAIAMAEDLVVTPQFDLDEPVPLWGSAWFTVHSEGDVRNESVMVFFNEGSEPDYEDHSEPMWVWLNEDGDGEFWFTPGVNDVYIFDYESSYNRDHTGYTYTLFAVNQHDNGNVSNNVTFRTEMNPEVPSAFTPAVTSVSSGSVRQDDVFKATVSNEEGFDVVCLVVFDSEGNYAADSHWVFIDHEAETSYLEAPLAKCLVNGEYTAKIYGLQMGYPMVYCDQEWPFRVINPSTAGTSDIVISGLKESYPTGEGVRPAVYYPNSEGLENLTMDISVYNTDDEFAMSNTEHWNLNATVWPDADGSLSFFPEADSWETPYIWWTGNYSYNATVWQQDENGEFIKVDSIQRPFKVTCEGPLEFDPQLPEYINAADMPYELTIPRVPNADSYYIRMEDWSDHDWEADPDWDNRIGEFSSDEEDGPATVTIRDVNQRIRVWIDACQYNREGYSYDVVIPVLKVGTKINLWTEDWVTINPQPIHTNIPLWVSASGADWLRLENDDGEFGFWGDTEEIARGIETNTGIHRDGVNHIVATASFNGKEEQAILTVYCYADGEAGAFSATLDAEEATRGDLVGITYTKSENADHYWVDLDVWNDEWNDWEWVNHLADLNVEGENVGGTTSLNTLLLEPNTYRVRALAEGAGYFTREVVLTESFTVRDVQIPDSGILVTVSAEDNQVETCEDFEVSALAPGAQWMQIFWDYQDDNSGWWNDSQGRDAYNWRCSYSTSGQRKILIRAWYNEYDEAGNPVWEIDEQTGEIHTDGDGNPDWHKQYAVDEIVEISVTADNGSLTLAMPAGIPETMAPSDEEKTVSFTVKMPENANYLRAEAWLEGVDDGGLCWLETWDGDLDVSFSLIPEDGQTITIRLEAQGRGYEASNQRVSIPVLQNSEISDLGFITIDQGAYRVDDDGQYSAPVQGHVRFLVSAAQGHTLTAVKFLGTHGWWENGEEINHDNHDDWFDHGSAFFHEDLPYESAPGSELKVRALVRVDNKPDWHLVEPLTVHVEDFWVGPYDFTSLEPVTVEYGKDATFTFTESEGAEQYWVDAWDADNTDNNYNPNTTYSGTTVTMNTAQLHVGEFIIRGRAGTFDGDLREAENSVLLIVTESDVPVGKVQLSVGLEPDESGLLSELTGKNIAVSIFAPGADWVELIRRNEDGYEDWFCQTGGSGATANFSENWSQTVEIFGRAHYFERDEEGNTIPELNENNDEILRELPWVDSESVLIKFTAPKGRLAQDASLIPVTAEANKDLRLVMPEPEDGWMGWEIYTNRDYNNDWQEWDYQGNGALDFTIPGSEVLLGNIIELRVWTDGIGYEHNHCNYKIMVQNESEDRITLRVSKSEVLTNEDFTVTVTAPGQEFIQYYNGYGFWTHWDDEEGRDVISDMGLDENGQWILDGENYGNAETMTLYARTFINGVPVTSDPVRVTVTSIGKVDSFPVWLEEETVTRGETVILGYEPADHSDENGYDLHHDRDREQDGEGNFVDYRLDWYRDNESNTFSFSTVDMPEGDYRLSVWARGEKGYEGRESQTLILHVRDAASDTVSLEIQNPNILTNEGIQTGVYAPGACHIEIFWGNNDSWNYDGESCTDRYHYNEAGTYQVFARAYYAQEGQEDRTIDSDPVTVTVSSNGKKIDLDLSGLPATLIAGEDKQLFVPWPEGAQYMGWEVFLNWDYDWSRQPDYKGEDDREELNVFLAGGELTAETEVNIRIWTGAAGYDNNYRDLTIPVVTAPEDSLLLSVNPQTIQNCETTDISVKFPAGIYDEVQLYTGREYYPIEPLEPDASVYSWEDLYYNTNGTYSLHVRFLNSEGTWVYSASETLEVTAENGPLAFDTSTVPAKIYEGVDASFTLVKPEHATEWNYRLYDDTNNEELIGWEGEKDGNITIPAAKVVSGHRYHLDYNACAVGYESVFGGIDFLGAEAPTVVLSVDKKSVRYGETVTFTASAPGAETSSVQIRNEEGDPTSLEGFTWTADRVGAVQFFAIVSFPGFSDVVFSNDVTVNVRTVGTAPAPTVTAPETLTEGETLTVTVTPAEGGWAGISIFDSGEDPVEKLDSFASEKTFSVANVHAGEYQVYVAYGKDGYDDGEMIELDIPVAHAYGAPVWVWTEDYSKATATFACGCGETTDPIEASLRSETVSEPTCDTAGEEKWTATVTFGGETFADIRTRVIEATGHNWDKPVFNWIESGTTVTATATFTCKTNSAHTRTETAAVAKTGHKEATCTDPEADVYTAQCEGYSEEYEVAVGNSLGHTGDWYAVWNDDYTAYAERVCDECGEVETARLAVDAEVLKEATCQARGEVKWTTVPLLGGPQVIASKKQYTPKTDHTPGEPTYTEDGMEIIECSVCHTVLSCEYPHAEHTWIVEYKWAEDNSTVTATRTCKATPAHPHSETETAGAVSSITRKADGSEELQLKFTAVFTKDCFETQTKLIPITSVLKLPAAMTRIESEAFSGIAAEAVIVPDGCTFIAKDAFTDCQNLAFISIPAGAQIEGGSLVGCDDVIIEIRSNE